MSDTAVTRPAQPAPTPLAGRDYRDLTTLTQWVKGLLVFSLLLDVIAVGSGVMEFSFLQNVAAGSLAGDFAEHATANDNRQMTIGVAQLVLYITTGIVFLSWIYRANGNARALGAKDMRFTPGWAVGWYFVPIMSLWKPFQAMREIWQASAAPGNWQSVQTPPLLGWWWALYLGANILGQIGLRLSKNIDSVDSAITASAFITAADIASVALDAAALLVVMKIAANQVWQTKTVEVF
jgi:hypothetical protein